MCLRYFAVSDFVVWSKWESEEERKRVFIGGKKSGVPFSHTHTLRLWTGIDSIIPPNSSPKTARKNTSSLLWTQKWELFDRIVISNRLYPLHQAREWEIKFDYWRKEGIYIVGWLFRLSDSIRRCFDGYLICFSPFVFFVFLCPESDLSIENWLSSLNLLMYRDNFALADVTDLQQASKMVADGHLSKVSTHSYFSIYHLRQNAGKLEIPFAIQTRRKKELLSSCSTLKSVPCLIFFSWLFFLFVYIFLTYIRPIKVSIMAVDPCACRDKHCAQKNEDSAAAKIHTNKLLDKAFFKMQCPSFEHQLCERDVNCGFDHDVASNQRFRGGLIVWLT